jgi:RNA polymerase sigma-70 factor, ECF subfamily
MRVEKECMQQHNECTQEKNAAAAFYDRYASSIFAYARLYTPSWEDAEDVTLEVLTAALEWENFSALTERQQLSWLRRVAHNKLVDRYRSAVHLPTVSLEQVMETVRAEEALAPEQMALRGEELERLYHAVRGLPLFQRQLILLRFGQGLRFAEIAVLLDKREAAIRKLCSRTIARLRAIYEQQ